MNHRLFFIVYFEMRGPLTMSKKADCCMMIDFFCIFVIEYILNYLYTGGVLWTFIIIIFHL